MAKVLYRYEGTVNRFTWFTTWNYALRNYYDDDIDYIPRPILGSEYNALVEFFSRKPGVATVDWGDGIVEQFPLVKQRGNPVYRIIFRSLNVEYRKNPDSHPWWFYKEDGSEYIPVPPHHYADDRKDIQRIVTIDFSSDIYSAGIHTCRMTGFPIVEIPGIESLHVKDTSGIPTIPQERLARATKLKGIYLYSIGGRQSTLSPAITDKVLLETLEIGNCFDFSDIENSGIRNIKNLKNLISFNNSSNMIKTYIKEYNELPNLNKLDINMGPGSLPDINDTPYFEVDKINPSITNLSYLVGWQNGYNRVEWPDQMSGKGLENLTEFSFTFQYKIRVDIFPEFVKEMRGMSYINASQCMGTQERADTFVNTFYDYVVGWDQMTMSNTAKDGLRNQFYGLSVTLYNRTYDYDYRPSGEMIAPSGFVNGVSNGDPTTPMEKIYVLTNNYKQRWTINPSTKT